MGLYYRLLADPKATTRWHLKSPMTTDGKVIDPRIFTLGCKYDGEIKLKLPLRREGEPIDFNFCDFDMIVTPKYLNDALESVVGHTFQRIPIDIESSNTSYEILNTLDTVSCINEEKSQYVKWLPQDGQLDKIGQYRMISKLVISPNQANYHKMFRINEWKIALVVEDCVKNLFEKLKVTGLIFQAVS